MSCFKNRSSRRGRSIVTVSQGTVLSRRQVHTALSRPHRPAPSSETETLSPWPPPQLPAATTLRSEPASPGVLTCVEPHRYCLLAAGSFPSASRPQHASESPSFIRPRDILPQGGTVLFKHSSVRGHPNCSRGGFFFFKDHFTAVSPKGEAHHLPRSLLQHITPLTTYSKRTELR